MPREKFELYAVHPSWLRHTLQASLNWFTRFVLSWELQHHGNRKAIVMMGAFAPHAVIRDCRTVEGFDIEDRANAGMRFERRIRPGVDGGPSGRLLDGPPHHLRNGGSLPNGVHLRQSPKDAYNNGILNSETRFRVENAD
jgi:hypothetical protein